jgi:hypothetical protein
VYPFGEEHHGWILARMSSSTGTVEITMNRFCFHLQD